MVCSHITVICLVTVKMWCALSKTWCAHITVICLCFSNNQDVYTHDNYYDCYALSKTWCAHT